jgi:hypothetical protein
VTCEWLKLAAPDLLLDLLFVIVPGGTGFESTPHDTKGFITLPTTLPYLYPLKNPFNDFTHLGRLL